MKIKSIKGILKLNSRNLSFVNVYPNQDTKKFINPISILKYNGNDFNYKMAIKRINDFFDCIINLYNQNNMQQIHKILRSIHEINDTHLGLGQSHYKSQGKGPSYDALSNSLHKVSLIYEKSQDLKLNFQSDYINKIVSFNIFTNNFGEDSFSDLITNIIYNELQEYTIKKIRKLNLEKYLHYDKKIVRKYWSIKEHNWVKKEYPELNLNTKTVLLVPNKIVSNSLREISAHRFISIVVAAKKQKEQKRKGKTPETRKIITKNIRKYNESYSDISYNEVNEDIRLILKYINIIRS